MRSRSSVLSSLAIIAVVGLAPAAQGQFARCRGCDYPTWDQLDRIERVRERALERAERARERSFERSFDRRSFGFDISERVNRALDRAMDPSFDRSINRSVQRSIDRAFIARERALDRADRIRAAHVRVYRYRFPR